jgi:hypothetical protein
MRLKPDENLSRHLKPALGALGHEVDTPRMRSCSFERG